MSGFGGGSGTGVGVSTATTGVAGVALLPNTGSFKVMFIVATAALAFGVITLVASGVMKLRARSTSK